MHINTERRNAERKRSESDAVKDEPTDKILAQI
jgi:hypothetical protein